MEFKKFCDYLFILEKIILFHLGFKLQIKLPGLLLSFSLGLWFDIVPVPPFSLQSPSFQWWKQRACNLWSLTSPSMGFSAEKSLITVFAFCTLLVSPWSGKVHSQGLPLFTGFKMRPHNEKNSVCISLESLAFKSLNSLQIITVLAHDFSDIWCLWVE